MREIHKVVSTIDFKPENREKLQQILCGCELVWVNKADKQTIAEEIRDADVVLLDGDLDDLILTGSQIRWIHCNHAGLNKSARPEVFQRGILLSGSGGRSSPVLAEHTIYFMLAACYHTRQLLEAQAACRWGIEGQEQCRGLFGRTAAILGMGNNGRMLAERLHALGMHLVSWDRNCQSDLDYMDKQYASTDAQSLEKVLQCADFICINLPLTDQTYHLLDKQAFAKVKKGAVLVNMGRGEIVDTQAMLEALDAGILSCAGLDVFEQEPLPANHPLWKHRNVYITPHFTPQVPDREGRCLEIICENIARYQRGEKLLNQMDPRDVRTGRST